MATRISEPFSDLTYRLWSSKAEKARRNYARVLGSTPDDPRAERLARECFRQFGLYVTEMTHVQGWDSHAVLDRLAVEGEHHFDEAEEHGRGVIFVSAHMGSAEVAAAVAVMRGSRITSVMEELHPRFLHDWAVEARRRMGITLLPATGSGIRLLRSLRKGGMVAFVVDVGIERVEGVQVDFFGRQTTFPAGPARLARLSGAPIVFGLAVRVPGGRYEAHISPPLFSDRTSDGDADIRSLTQQVAAIFEGHVRRYPAQWYAFRDMWPE